MKIQLGSEYKLIVYHYYNYKMSLGKHKFYCEMCRKQCKDDNAFQ